MGKDLNIYETGNGGDLEIFNGDLSFSESLFKDIYVSLFGGNVEASTLGNEEDNEERFDFWANSLLFQDQKEKQFNSETERILNTVVLNSSGRIFILNAVKEDLSFIREKFNLEVDVFLLNRNRVKIEIKILSVSNELDHSLQLIWDSLKNQIITQKII